MLKDAPITAYVPCSDLPRARRFYEQKIGLVPGDENPGGIIYKCGKGTVFFLYKTAFAGTNKASCAFFQVADVEKEVAELRAKGVTFEEYDLPGLATVDGVATFGPSKSAWFTDPEGNILALVQTG